MRTFTFILFVMLISLICFMTAHEHVETYRAGYRIGKVMLRKDKLNNLIAIKKHELAFLKNPENLEALNRDLGLNLKPRPVVVVKNEDCSDDAVKMSAVDKGS